MVLRFQRMTLTQEPAALSLIPGVTLGAKAFGLPVTHQ